MKTCFLLKLGLTVEIPNLRVISEKRGTGQSGKDRCDWMAWKAFSLSIPVNQLIRKR